MKAAATPKPKPARRTAAPSDDDEAREELEGGVAGGVVGGVVGGVLGSSTPSSPAEPAIDREREVAQLRQALATAQGQERARLLRRLCDALDALGRTREADSACDTVIREFPASEEAKSALERLKVRAAEQR